MTRLLVALSGLVGLLGVVLAALGAHGPAGGTTLSIAANFLLFHAPVLLALAIAAEVGVLSGGLARLAALLIVAGLALFCGDLALRAIETRPLFPFAAPLGGVALMLGWAAVIVAGLFGGDRAPPR